MSDHLAVPERSSGLATILSRRRQVYGVVVAALAPPLLTMLLLPTRQSLGLDTVLLLFVLASVVASAVGGILPAVVASVISGGLANFFFAIPYGTFVVESPTEVVDLVIFLAVSLLVGVTTELTARQSAREERHRLEATWIAEVGTRQPGRASVEVVLAEALEMYTMHAAALVREGRVLVTAGTADPEDKVLELPAGEDLTLRLSGPERVGESRSLLGSWALAAGQLWRTQELAAQARRAEELARVDELRASLLAAVGHDLRNPLAAITAAASTLQQMDIELTGDERDELLETIVDHAARLNDLIANLLDMSRLQAGALSVFPRAVAVEDVVAHAVREFDADGIRVEIEVPDDLPEVTADPPLLERVLANLVTNASRFSPPGMPPTVTAAADGDAVTIRVIDHGPACRQPSGTRSSSLSSAVATPTTRPGWVSGSRSPAVSPRRWVAR